jgi:hypothetical protein
MTPGAAPPVGLPAVHAVFVNQMRIGIRLNHVHPFVEIQVEVFIIGVKGRRQGLCLIALLLSPRRLPRFW